MIPLETAARSTRDVSTFASPTTMNASDLPGANHGLECQTTRVPNTSSVRIRVRSDYIGEQVGLIVHARIS